MPRHFAVTGWTQQHTVSRVVSGRFRPPADAMMHFALGPRTGNTLPAVLTGTQDATHYGVARPYGISKRPELLGILALRSRLSTLGGEWFRIFQRLISFCHR